LSLPLLAGKLWMMLEKARKLRLGPFSLSFRTLSRSYQFLKNSMVTPWRISVTTGRLWLMPEKARRLRKGSIFFVFSSSFQITNFLKIHVDPSENLGDR
jgi:hypothetical protein